MSARSTTGAPPRRGAFARSRIPAGVVRRLEELAEREGLPLEALVLAGVAAGAARYGVEPGATLALEGRVRLRASAPDLAELGRGLAAAARLGDRPPRLGANQRQDHTFGDAGPRIARRRQ
jgi:hypothetical protein